MAISREHAIGVFAARLYWRMEQSLWEDLTEHQREFYRLCVSDLLEFDGLARAIYEGGTNDKHSC
jgi:hypothetical protein